MRTSLGIVAAIAAAILIPLPASASVDEAAAPELRRPVCAGGETDVGDGTGDYLCVPSSNVHCPSTNPRNGRSMVFVDANGNGSLDYGECRYAGSSPPATQPPATQPPATQPPATQPPATQPPATNAPGTPPPAGTNAPPVDGSDDGAGDGDGDEGAAPVGADTPAGAEPVVLTSPEGATLTVGPLAAPAADPAPALIITSAEVLCDGTISVAYETSAGAPASAAVEHLVVFHPLSNPVDFHVSAFAGLQPEGSFEFAQAGSAADSYRVFVTVAFDPTDAAAPTLAAWAQTTLAAGC